MNPLVSGWLDEFERDPQARERLGEMLLGQLADRLWPRSPWLDVSEAAEYLRCTRQRVYDLRHSGALQPARDGRRLLFHRDELDRYLCGDGEVAA